MKRKDLIGKLKKYGWYLKRQGSKHEIWSNGDETEAVPRHKEINENLVNDIIKYAQKYPGTKK